MRKLGQAGHSRTELVFMLLFVDLGVRLALLLWQSADEYFVRRGDGSGHWQGSGWKSWFEIRHRTSEYLWFSLIALCPWSCWILARKTRKLEPRPSSVLCKVHVSQSGKDTVGQAAGNLRSCSVQELQGQNVHCPAIRLESLNVHNDRNRNERACNLLRYMNMWNQRIQ